MRILVTRPALQAVEFAKKIHDMGFKPEIEPMLAIEPLPFSPLKTAPDLILLSSQNAVPFLQGLEIDRTTPIIAVGDKTKELSLEHGYKKIKSISGDAQKLLQNILTEHPSSFGRILHVSGSNVQIDLAKELSLRGYDAHQKAVYRTIPQKTLSNNVQNLIQSKQLHAATFLSQKTTNAFLSAMRFAQIDESAIKDLKVYCLSHNIAALFEKQGAWQINVAPDPTEASLLALIIRSLHSCGDKKN